MRKKDRDIGKHGMIPIDKEKTGNDITTIDSYTFDLRVLSQPGSG